MERVGILIKRAMLHEADLGVFGYDYKNACLDRIQDNEFVTLRGKGNTRLFSVYVVDEWDVEKLDYHEWPNRYLDEAMGKSSKQKNRNIKPLESVITAIAV